MGSELVNGNGTKKALIGIVAVIVIAFGGWMAAQVVAVPTNYPTKVEVEKHYAELKLSVKSHELREQELYARINGVEQKLAAIEYKVDRMIILISEILADKKNLNDD